MFPWNIAKSAEAMFSRWAVKRVCKFLLKKKLGQFILGDIDLDQLDVQLTDGTIQLNDLALNVDYLNKTFAAEAPVIIKEGSIGSLLVQMPWKGKGCQVEVDELELVLAPCAENNSAAGGETCSLSQDGNHCVRDDLGKIEDPMVENATTSTSVDVHEGVKTIAKMVKWLLTSFHVKIKKLIVAFDPFSENDEKKSRCHTSLVLRIAEIECGTCVSEDSDSSVDARTQCFLGISQLTNFVKFQGAILELLLMDDVDDQTYSPCASGSTLDELFLGCCPLNATTPIMTGKSGGFSGNLKLSIPWKNGSLDIRKVDADICIDPVELRFQPRTIKWFLLSWETYKNLEKDRRGHMHYKSTDSVYFNSPSHWHSSSPASAAIPTEKVVPIRGSFSADFSSLTGQESVTEALLPGSQLISDWVPFSANKNGKDGNGEELDFGASVDQFFECLDGIRNSQSALGSSGIWNWTCSVFSAITAASSLASGSLNIPSDQQHVETNIKAAIAGISILFSFHDEHWGHLCDLKSDRIKVGLNVNYLGAECRDVILGLQVCTQEMKFEGTMKYIEVANYLSNKNDAMGFGLRASSDEFHNRMLLIQHLQAEVQGALPPFASSTEDPDLSRQSGLVAADFLHGNSDGVVKITLLRTSGVTHCQCSVNSSSSGGSSTRPTLFSLKLPPFVFWVNFRLMIMLLDLLKEVEESVEMNNKKNRFPSEALNDKHGSSYGNVKRGSGPCVATLSSTESLRGNILIPNARVILCFPFLSGEDYGGYSSWDQFIALDFSSPSTLNKEIIQDASSHKRCSSTATRTLHLNVGSLDIYLVTVSCKDDVGISSCGEQRQKLTSQNILSVTNKTGCLSAISMLWQDGPVTGPWIAKKAKFLATLEESRSRYKFVGKGYEFASATTVKDLEDLYSQTRQEMILSSAFFVHVCLSPVTINLGSSLYKNLHCLLTQVINGLSCVAPDALSATVESSVSQTSILVECDSVELLISPDTNENIKSSMENELPGSWHCLKLKIQNFELLSVSNIGGIKGANFFWLAHGEGKLCGSVTGVPDQEFLLISCRNSTMKRGDGEGSNALSSRIAGSDFVYLSEPESSHSFTSITVRCGTIVAVGGRLDWLDAISSFFSLPSPEIEQAGDSSLQQGDLDAACGASFTLNLVDIGLSYEPHLKNSAVSAEVLDPESSCSSYAKEEMGEQYVACLLAASSLNLSNTTMPDSIHNDYKIRVQDLGLLLCAVSEPENIGGTYSVEHLDKIGYVKVAREALIEVILRTNSKSGLLWEVECSKSHMYLETCHDTTSGLIRLAAQLQQLFAPDMEESVVHLQTRWNNVQEAQDRNDVNDDSKIFNSDSAPSTSHVHTLDVGIRTKSRVVGLMDEICEDAFRSEGNQTCQIGSSESQVRISLDECLLGEVCNLDETPEIFSHDQSFNQPVPVIGLESSQTSFLQRGFFPEFIEGYCLSELRPLSELSVGKQPLPEVLNCKSRNVGNGDLRRGTGGWYGDTSLRIVENHIQEVSELTSRKQFVEGKLPSIDLTRLDEFGTAVGRVLLKNINVRWRMYGGSHWHDSRKNCEHSTNICGRDTAVYLELVLSGMEFQYDVFPVGGICVSKQSLSVKDFHLYDRSKNAPWKLVLGYYCSKDHPRESSSKAFKLCLEAVRPDPLIPLEEYRLSIAFLPLLLHLHQSQLDFLISFFGTESLSSDPSSGHHQDSGGSKMLPTKSNNFSGHNIVDEALLPYFQKFDVWPVLVRVDYIPRRVDLAALRGGKYVELVNLVPWKGVELQLKHVHAVGVYGWSGVCETIIGEWLEDISQNQIHKLLRGFPTIKSLIAVGAGAAKLISYPVENYKKDQRVLKGMQRGTIAFLRSISLEAVGLGVHLAAGAHDILLQAEYILTSIPPSVPWTVQSKRKSNIRSNQPKNAQQGIRQAYESLGDGLGKSASALVRTPLKRYQRGAGAGSALATAVRAVPAAAIAPASACASAVHYALLGLRNSLDPEHKKESMEKYLGPTQPPEQI